MHISNTEIQKIFETHVHKVRNSAIKPSEPARKSDQLTLSRQATDMQNIKQYVSMLPDIRQDKVREIQRTIEKGAYQISDEDIASAMFKSIGQG